MEEEVKYDNFKPSSLFNSDQSFIKNEIKIPIKFGADERFRVFLIKKQSQRVPKGSKNKALVQLTNFAQADSGSSLEYGNLQLTFLG